MTKRHKRTALPVEIPYTHYVELTQRGRTRGPHVYFVTIRKDYISTSHTLYSVGKFLRLRAHCVLVRCRPPFLKCIQQIYVAKVSKITGRAGGHSGSEGGRTRVTFFAEEGMFLKTSACPRFCKRRVLFCTQVRSMGSENPLTKYTRL